MGKIIRPDQMHRLVKLALDTGEASTLEEAERLFAGYRLGIAAGRDVAHSPTLQAAVLTAVNAGRRSFLGGVSVAGALDVPLRVPWRDCRTLAPHPADYRWPRARRGASATIAVMQPVPPAHAGRVREAKQALRAQVLAARNALPADVHASESARIFRRIAARAQPITR